jgi:cytochrome c oxidase accessory protein FixG
MTTSRPITAPGRVLSTLNEDGSRRWIRPRPTPGGWWHRRRLVAYGLMLVFFAIPYLRLGGKPLVLLDLPAREFTILGATFLPTDTLLFMLLFVSAGIGIFLVTTLFGRVWCGWACPQTVYMEFLFRPIERALEGGFRGSLKLDAGRGVHAARIAKYAIYLMLAMFLAHTFLAYFVGIDRLLSWVQGSPRVHLVAFLVMAGTTLAIFADFAWYREQTCLVACPYGRLQSVLFDRRTLIVAYDPRRGEPRMKGVKPRPSGAGDCIECRNCVTTCPTGIDIRDGLQMECIQCTQCIDACDEVMVKIGQPTGLIRYASRAELDGQPRRFLRTRVLLYPVALAISLGLFATFLYGRASTEVTLLRGTGALYQRYDAADVVSDVRIKLSNRNRERRAYHIELLGGDGTRLIAPLNPFPVEGGHTQTATVFVVSPVSAFRLGERHVMFRIEDGRGFGRNYVHPLAGPMGPEPSGRGGEQ